MIETHTSLVTIKELCRIVAVTLSSLSVAQLNSRAKRRQRLRKRLLILLMATKLRE